MPDAPLSGRRVLVVEDEYFLARELERGLRAAGSVVIGPVPSIEAALDLLAGDPAPEVALLDINLGGEKVFPVADALTARSIPFVFTTGYDEADILARFSGTPRLQKPIDLRKDIGAFATACGLAS